MEDTFVIQQAKHSQQLLQHINSQDPHIQFTTEEPNQEGALPFLDTLVSPGPSKTLVTTVYRKPTHTNQYLHWDNNHLITAKYYVFNTLAFRAKGVCSNQHTLQQETDHIRKTLLACNFQPWTLNSLHTTFNHKCNNHNTQATTMDQHNNSNN